ncbi:uncharacterized protein LOC121589224 isoform X3 [Anopheles merus]|uniref:uncharacterized protein LOC121589224 isoform X3 n=1 Tax=Anopheles merus TaxID=30066 RepID=UPI001BE4635F|nr:uncharacterized protein LOC121589224 isoform X3 [Anopheles merus]
MLHPAPYKQHMMLCDKSDAVGDDLEEAANLSPASSTVWRKKNPGKKLRHHLREIWVCQENCNDCLRLSSSVRDIQVLLLHQIQPSSLLCDSTHSAVHHVAFKHPDNACVRCKVCLFRSLSRL